MTSVTIEEAQARLPELIEKLIPGQELVILANGAEVAKLAKSVQRATGEPAHKLGVGAIIGKWPGDETDEQIETALRRLS
jgi:antitoxin (DNA-binding transcriptional repressor) of toxin-antitoxin stability system